MLLCYWSHKKKLQWTYNLIDELLQKIVNDIGPLARVWKATEDVKNDQRLTLSVKEGATSM